jgi:hypothetical protein
MKKVPVSVIITTSSCHTEQVNKSSASLNAKCLIASKSYLVMPRISMRIARPDITAGLHEREPTCSADDIRGALPVLKEVPVELTLWQHSLRTWVFVAMIVNEFILGLDALHTHTVFMGVEQCVPQLGEQEVQLGILGCDVIIPLHDGW